MSGTTARLFVHCEVRQLDILLQGIASCTGMQYCSTSLLGKSESTWVQSLKGIWVIGVTEIREEHLVWTKRLSYGSALPVVLIADVLPRERVSQLRRNGAIACLRTSEALQELPCILENLVRCLLRDSESIPVATHVVLILPSLVLCDGTCEMQLTPILGRLLACLAQNAGYLVPHDRLIQAAWGRSDRATVKTLHQHIHNLRKTLADFGIARIIRAIRGSGYMLAKS